MQLKLLAAGTRVPAWVSDGFQDFARRMPRGMALVLEEIPVARRTPTHGIEQCLAEEDAQFRKRIPTSSHLVALDVTGRSLSTEQLAVQLARWRDDGRDTCLMIGGPDGLHSSLVSDANFRWSLSPLTLPHALVRVVAAEALYRAWSVLENHPYHRGNG